MNHPVTSAVKSLRGNWSSCHSGSNFYHHDEGFIFRKGCQCNFLSFKTVLVIFLQSYTLVNTEFFLYEYFKETSPKLFSIFQSPIFKHRTMENSPISSCDTSDTECSVPVNSAAALKRPSSSSNSPCRGHVLRKAKVRRPVPGFLPLSLSFITCFSSPSFFEVPTPWIPQGEISLHEGLAQSLNFINYDLSSLWSWACLLHRSEYWELDYRRIEILRIDLTVFSAFCTDFLYKVNVNNADCPSYSHSVTLISLALRRHFFLLFLYS